MKRDPNFIFSIFLAIGDIVALVASFTVAYIIRVTFTAREFIPIDSRTFIITIAALIPVWIIVFYLFDLYKKSIYLYKPKEFGRLLLASLISMTIMISYSYFTDIDLFPAKLVPIYSLAFGYAFLIINRQIIKGIRNLMLKKRIGQLRVIIAGDSFSTSTIIREIADDKKSEYKIVAVVARKEFIPYEFQKLKSTSLASALEDTSADLIIQTDDHNLQKVYQESIDHHLGYMFVPSQEVLLSSDSQIELFGSLPIIQIRPTPLIGYGKFIKRLSDIILGTLALIIASPFILVIACISKISDPKGKVFFKHRRLSIYGKKVQIYKFRSMKSEYNGLSPEEAFTKLGKPELIDKYRKNGDQLKNDPRVTKLGKFLRKTSLDELPQLLNVVKGDISLVGPRALVPGELNKYPNKNLILSVKSGLTGLAQVSGRRDISFEERRSLDVYYVQNWSLLMDMQIIFKTVYSIITGRGAK